MITQKKNYIFVDFKSLTNIGITGGILPKRDAKLVFKSEDVAHLCEALAERQAIKENSYSINRVNVDTTEIKETTHNTFREKAVEIATRTPFFAWLEQTPSLSGLSVVKRGKYIYNTNKDSDRKETWQSVFQFAYDTIQTYKENKREYKNEMRESVVQEINATISKVEDYIHSFLKGASDALKDLNDAKQTGNTDDIKLKQSIYDNFVSSAVAKDNIDIGDDTTLEGKCVKAILELEDSLETRYKQFIAFDKASRKNVFDAITSHDGYCVDGLRKIDVENTGIKGEAQSVTFNPSCLMYLYTRKWWYDPNFQDTNTVDRNNKGYVSEPFTDSELLPPWQMYEKTHVAPSKSTSFTDPSPLWSIFESDDEALSELEIQINDSAMVESKVCRFPLYYLKKYNTEYGLGLDLSTELFPIRQDSDTVPRTFQQAITAYFPRLLTFPYFFTQKKCVIDLMDFVNNLNKTLEVSPNSGRLPRTFIKIYDNGNKVATEQKSVRFVSDETEGIFLWRGEDTLSYAKMGSLDAEWGVLDGDFVYVEKKNEPMIGWFLQDGSYAASTPLYDAEIKTITSDIYLATFANVYQQFQAEPQKRDGENYIGGGTTNSHAIGNSGVSFTITYQRDVMTGELIGGDEGINIVLSKTGDSAPVIGNKSFDGSKFVIDFTYQADDGYKHVTEEVSADDLKREYYTKEGLEIVLLKSRVELIKSEEYSDGYRESREGMIEFDVEYNNYKKTQEEQLEIKVNEIRHSWNAQIKDLLDEFYQSCEEIRAAHLEAKEEIIRKGNEEIIVLFNKYNATNGDKEKAEIKKEITDKIRAINELISSNTEEEYNEIVRKKNDVRNKKEEIRKECNEKIGSAEADFNEALYTEYLRVYNKKREADYNITAARAAEKSNLLSNHNARLASARKERDDAISAAHTKTKAAVELWMSHQQGLNIDVTADDITEKLESRNEITDEWINSLYYLTPSYSELINIRRDFYAYRDAYYTDVDQATQAYYASEREEGLIYAQELVAYDRAKRKGVTYEYQEGPHELWSVNITDIAKSAYQKAGLTMLSEEGYVDSGIGPLRLRNLVTEWKPRTQYDNE